MLRIVFYLVPLWVIMYAVSEIAEWLVWEDIKKKMGKITMNKLSPIRKTRTAMKEKINDFHLR